MFSFFVGSELLHLPSVSTLDKIEGNVFTLNWFKVAFMHNFYLPKSISKFVQSLSVALDFDALLLRNKVLKCSVVRWKQFGLICLLLVWFVGGSWAQEAQPEREPEQVPKIIFREDAKLGAEYRKNRRDFFRQQLKLYEQHTKDPRKLRQPAKQYLLSAISYYTRQHIQEDDAWLPASELFEKGKQLLADGSEDPLIWMYHASVLNTLGYQWGRGVGLTKDNRAIGFQPDDNPLEVSQKALKAFNTSDYPAGLKILFLGELNRAMEDFPIRSKPKQYTEDDLKFLNAIPDWVKFVKGAPDWERIVYPAIQRHREQKYDSYRSGGDKTNGAKELARIHELSRKKHLSQWLYQMMLADHHSTFPYSGQLSASRYSEEKYKRFVAKLPEDQKEPRRTAAKHYRAAYEIASHYPEAASRLILLSYQGYESEDRWTWFQRAIDAELDNPEAYTNLSFASNRMSSEGVVELAYQFYESERFDTRIPHQFLTFINHNLGRAGLAHLLYRDAELFDDVKDLYTRSAEEDGVKIEDTMLNGRQVRPIRNLVATAAAAGRYDVAVKYAQLLDNMYPGWYRLTKDRVFLNSMIHARHKHENELRDIAIGFRHDLVFFPNMEIDELVDRYEVLVDQCDPMAAPFLEMCLAMVRQKQQYETGEWVRPSTTFPADHLWGIRGNFLCKDDNTIEVSSNPKMGKYGRGFFNLSHKLKFPLPREIQCDINLLSWKGNAELSIQGYPSVGVFLLKPQEGKAGVWGMKNGKHVIRRIPILGLKPREPVHLSIKVWDKSNYQYFVNGMLVDVGDLELEKVTGDLGFHGSSTVWGDRVEEIAARISNVRVRKIDVSPPPSRDKPEEGLEYFTDAIESEPELALNYLRRAQCHDQLGNIEEAIVDYRNGLERDSRVGAATVRFVQLCLTAGKYSDSKKTLTDALLQFQATEKVVAQDLLLQQKTDKKNAFKQKRSKAKVELALSRFGLENREQFQEMVTSYQNQLLVLYATCPDETVRSKSSAEELLKVMDFKNDTTSGVRWLAKAYAQAELGQQKGALQSLAAAKAASKSSGLKSKIESATQALEKQEPIRLTGDQINFLKSIEPGKE